MAASATEQPENSETRTDGGPTAVERLIERFGGLRPMADKVGVPVSTVQGWKKRAAIPGGRQAELRAAAGRHGIAVGDEFESAFRAEAEPVAAPAEPVVAPAEPAVAPVEAAKPVEASPVVPSAAEAVPEPVVAPVEAAPVTATAAPAGAEPPAAPQPAPVPAPPAPPPVVVTRVEGRGVAIAACILALIGAGVSVTAPMWSPNFLARSIDISMLGSRVGLLEASAGKAAAAGATLAERVDALEKVVAGLASKSGLSVADLLAARELRAALASGRPFQSELALVRVSALADEATLGGLDTIAPMADAGVPTRAAVNAGFAAAVPGILAAEAAAPGGGLSQRVWGWVTVVANVVRVPVSMSSDPQSTTALLGRAAGMIERGELAAAVDLVSLIQAPTAQAAGPWLASARARLAADQVDALIAKRAAAALP